MSCPGTGRRAMAAVPNGWRDRCRRDTPRPPHATAREYASTGHAATSLRGRDCLRAGPDRPAKLTRTPARAADAVPGAADLPCSMLPADAPTGRADGFAWPRCASGKHVVVDAATALYVDVANGRARPGAIGESRSEESTVLFRSMHSATAQPGSFRCAT